jgi:cell division protein FtsB
MQNKFTIGVSGYRQFKSADENRRLQEQVTTLQQENAQLKSQVEQLTTARAGLQRDYDALKAENEALQVKHGKPAKAAPTH